MSEKHFLLIKKIAQALLYLLAIAFSIKSLREPDLWWQIRTGEWILENGKVPLHDVFSYTREGVRWINIKWGSEVIAAIVTKLSGPESVVLIQAAMSCLILFFLLKWTKIYAGISKGNLIAVALLGVPLLIGTEYRMTGRPEMYSHLFTVVFCYIYYGQSKNASKLISLIIPLQLLWANLHEAFAIGFVISAIFVVASWLLALIQKQSYKLSLQLLLIAVLSALGVMLNPNGIDLLMRPFAIYGQLEANQYTTELFSIINHQYWQKEAWIAFSGILMLLLACLLFVWKNRKHLSLDSLHASNVAYMLLVVAFSYLASTAFRNIIFLELIIFPALVLIAGGVIDKVILQRPKIELRLWIIAMALIGFVHVAVVSNKWYEWTKSRDAFGLEVLSINNPDGAADFLKKNNVKGKIFSDYLTSSYLLWKLQPDFKTFIDLRDLDVFSDTSFNDFAAIVQIPEVFEQQDSIYHFSAVVLYRPQFTVLHKYLYESAKWRAVFADAVAVVYLRDSSADNLIFSKCRAISNTPISGVVNKILNPLHHNYDYEVFDNDKIAASYFTNVGDFEQALKYGTVSYQSGKEPLASLVTLGDIYYNMALAEAAQDKRTEFLQAALQYYQSAITKDKTAFLARLGLGAVFFQNGNYRAAAEQFDEGIKHNSDELNLYLFAAQAYSQLMATDKTANEMVWKYYKEANRLNPNNPVIILNIATAAYRAGDCEEALNFATQLKEVPDFNEQEKNVVKTILTKCGNK